ncbi:MAG: hypothetical protein ACSW8H_06055 [bacterium]
MPPLAAYFRSKSVRILPESGWFFEIKEENAAVPGRCSSGGRALSADRSGAETGEAF